MRFRYLALLFLLCSNVIFAQEPVPWQIGLQDAVTPVMHELNKLHNILMWICSGIVLFVFLLLIYVLFRFSAKRNKIPAKFSHNVTLEVVWTVIPLIILVIIAIPSFRTLKFAEHTPHADMTVKVVGAQWYWTYSYPDHENIEFDSNIIQDADLLQGQKRLLDVDNRLIIPVDTNVRFLVTASDVLHSFAVPAFGIKIDAIPGRINETWVKVEKEGVYYGQCSELCGTQHGFMPIALEVVSKEEFAKWIEYAKTHFAFNSYQDSTHTLPKIMNGTYVSKINN